MSVIVAPAEAFMDETGDENSRDTSGLLEDTDCCVRVNDAGKQPSNGMVPQVFARRWYILMMFSLAGLTQGCIWNTWGPISESAEAVFGWNDATVGLLSNWGPIAYVIGTPFAVWLMDVKGLRWATISTMLMVTLGSGLRCIPVDKGTATWLIHIGHLLNGLGGPVAMGAAPLLSATWFPANERITATAIGAGFNGFGVAVSFIIAPLLVSQNTSVHQTVHAGNVSYLTDASIATMKSDIMKLMYIEFGFSAAVLLIILAYFPARPPCPPSISASIQRVDYKDGFCQLIRTPAFWVIGAVYAVSSGMFNCWQSVLEVQLAKRDITQHVAGWLGFYQSLAGNAAGLVVGRFADTFKRRIKLYIILIYSGIIICFYVYTIGYERYIPFTIELLYSTQILVGCFSGASTPLFFEIACEVSYPVAEGLTNGVLTLLNNISGLIFLLVMMVPNIGTDWMNWVVMSSYAACLPLLLLMRERYTRLDIDTATHPGGHVQKCQDT